MTIHELNEEQLRQVKQRYYVERHNASYEDLINIERLVTDEEVFEEYEGTEFVEEDFV